MSCEEQACTPMPIECTKINCQLTTENTMLQKDANGFMVCLNCGDSYGRRLQAEIKVLNTRPEPEATEVDICAAGFVGWLCPEACIVIKRLQAEIEVLKDYARCKNSCDSWNSGPSTVCECTCGLDAILET